MGVLRSPWNVQGLRLSQPWRDACAPLAMVKPNATRKGFRRTWLDKLYEWKTPLFDRYYKEVQTRAMLTRIPRRALA